MKSFNECCNVLYGFPFDSNFFNEDGSGTPLIRVRDINSGFSGTYTTEVADDQYIINDGDLLVSMDGDFCAKVWNFGIALLNQRTCKMNGKSDVINDTFLLYYLIPELEEIHRNTSATTVKHLSAKEINKLKVPIPPIDQQKLFEEFVKHADKSKILMKKCFEKYDQLVKSRFIEMFGDPLANPMMWDTEPLYNVTTIIRNGFAPPNAKSAYTDDGVVFLQSQNVWNNRIEYDDTQFISEDLNSMKKSTELMIGDVLITKTGRINTENSSLGRVSLFRGHEKAVNISSEIYLIRVTNVLNPEFLMHLLLTDSYRRFIRSCSPGGTDKRHLYSRYVEQFKIILPPIELQNQFVDSVQQVDKSKFIPQHRDENVRLHKSYMNVKVFCLTASSLHSEANIQCTSTENPSMAQTCLNSIPAGC